jgi:ubiquinone biosynthesis protein COQ9
MLRHAPFDGWTERALAAAARDEGVGVEMAHIAFQGGPAEIAEFFSAEADRQMVESLQTALSEGALPQSDIKVRERVALAVRTRLLQHAGHREALRALAAFLAMPIHAGLATRCVWRTVDAMWRAIGDTSTDFNYYTKRGLLAGVYGSTFLVWLDDSSEDFAESFAFLDRRIDDVMAFERGKARLRQSLSSVFRRAGAIGPRPRNDGRRPGGPLSPPPSETQPYPPA